MRGATRHPAKPQTAPFEGETPDIHEEGIPQRNHQNRQPLRTARTFRTLTFANNWLVAGISGLASSVSQTSAP